MKIVIDMDAANVGYYHTNMKPIDDAEVIKSQCLKKIMVLRAAMSGVVKYSKEWNKLLHEKNMIQFNCLDSMHDTYQSGKLLLKNPSKHYTLNDVADVELKDKSE